MESEESIDRDAKLKSLKPEDLLQKLDLNGSGLERAWKEAEGGDRDRTLSALLEHFRRKFPLPDSTESPEKRNFGTADKVVNHVLQWGPYEEADYGPEMDWEWDPRGDIEWVAAVYRFYWAGPLAAAYQATRDEKYAASFVELTTDWISKHTLEDRQRVHPVYTYWRGYVWLDIQTGIRATNICSAFRTLVHAEAFTPEFLGILMASLYDHQVKTKLIPMNRVHNKAIFEQRGFINIAHTFPEFSETGEWLELALRRSTDVLLEQTTSDGVQREWSYGYHQGVLRDAVEIRDRMAAAGVSVPEVYWDRVRKMYDYIHWIATPDLGAPMFGDGSRPLVDSEDRSSWPLYSVLNEATDLLGDPKYAARANLDRSVLPEQKSQAFADAGMYVMRSDWGPEQIHLGLHCSPLAISKHDQPDNGTFELYAYGRWLMPDTGFYIYGQDSPDREWHRQTRVHQTLTMDGKDSQDEGRHLLWISEPTFDVVSVENQSYEDLVHRRTIWFVDRLFYVILDECLGDAQGDLELHYQFAPGELKVDPGEGRARTCFEDANVMVTATADTNLTLTEEEGWFAWSYGHRKARPAIRYGCEGAAPASILSLVVPYRGSNSPEASGTIPPGYVAGSDRVELEVSAFGKSYVVGRDLASGEGWCK
jgi:heparan-sulfate lyase